MKGNILKPEFIKPGGIIGKKITESESKS